MPLYLVSTPIGNLSDITFRAVETLKTVDYIAAEDTRHSQKLFQRYEIKTPTLSFHSYSNFHKLQSLVDLLKNNKNIALISDAGTPGISDPGYLLIQEALKNNIKIIPIPGPTAFVPALTVSGLPIDKFLYLGFLPVKKGRQTLFLKLKEEKHTVVFYESPHRLLKTLKDLEQYLSGDRPISVARELTKIYEEIFRGTVSAAVKHFEQNSPRGEFVVVLGGKEK